jgi:hypothetical protein
VKLLLAGDPCGHQAGSRERADSRRSRHRQALVPGQHLRWVGHRCRAEEGQRQVSAEAGVREALGVRVVRAGALSSAQECGEANAGGRPADREHGTVRDEAEGHVREDSANRER